MTGITPEWAAAQMPRVARAVAGLPDMHGVRLAMSMHLDMKMVPLVAGLRAKGAELYIITCNPATVRDAVVAEMRGLGAEVAAWKDMGQADWDAAIAGGIDWAPRI